jgi:hypothetical protein
MWPSDVESFQGSTFCLLWCSRLLWYSRGRKEFAESIWYLWGIICCNILFLHTCVLRIPTAFNLVKIHLLFRIMLLTYWSVIISIFAVHVFIIFGRLKYIPRLFSEYMLTFIVEEPMKICYVMFIFLEYSSNRKKQLAIN